MTNRTRNRSRFLSAIVGMALAFTAGCEAPPPAEGATPPDRPEFAVNVQEVSDSTVVLRADWSGEADLWRWSLEEVDGPQVETGETATETTLDLELARADSTWTARFCVWGVNTRGSDEAEGDAACGTGDVPPVPLEAPAAPDSLNVDIDTTTASTAADSLRTYGYASSSLVTDTLRGGEGDTVAVVTNLTYRDGRAYICATVEGNQGWYEIVAIEPEPMVSLASRMIPDEDPACGVESFVEDTTIAALSDLISSDIPVISVLVSDMSPSSYSAAVAEAGTPVYVDRDFVLDSLPLDVQGGTLIQTANDDKQTTDPEHLTFTLENSAMVWVAHDGRIDLPTWLSDWTDTGLTPTTTDSGDPEFTFYRKQFDAGTITLGGNEGITNSSMYWVVLTPAGDENLVLTESNLVSR